MTGVPEEIQQGTFARAWSIPAMVKTVVRPGADWVLTWSNRPLIKTVTESAMAPVTVSSSCSLTGSGSPRKGVCAQHPARMSTPRAVRLSRAVKEIVWRGFIFRRLSEGRSFRTAVCWTMPFVVAAHVPILFSNGVLVAIGALLDAAVTSVPLSYLYVTGRRTVWARPCSTLPLTASSW